MEGLYIYVYVYIHTYICIFFFGGGEGGWAASLQPMKRQSGGGAQYPIPWRCEYVHTRKIMFEIPKNSLLVFSTADGAGVLVQIKVPFWYP